MQTLNFIPYRVDLTPFAGVLSNGAPHMVALSVAGANGYFSAAASLLVYLDAHANQVNGAVTRNTLAGQSPTSTIGETLVTDSGGGVSGEITTTLSRHFVIDGYADTSHGRVTSTVEQTVGFADTQGFTINDTTYRQVTDQLTTADSVSRDRLGAMAYRRIRAADTLLFDASGNLASHSGQHSAQRFTFKDSIGSCYRTDVATQSGAVSAYSSGQGCPDRANRLLWFSHPDGSPDNGNTVLGW